MTPLAPVLRAARLLRHLISRPPSAYPDVAGCAELRLARSLARTTCCIPGWIGPAHQPTPRCPSPKLARYTHVGRASGQSDAADSLLTQLADETTATINRPRVAAASRTQHYYYKLHSWHFCCTHFNIMHTVEHELGCVERADGRRRFLRQPTHRGTLGPCMTVVVEPPPRSWSVVRASTWAAGT